MSLKEMKAYMYTILEGEMKRRIMDLKIYSTSIIREAMTFSKMQEYWVLKFVF